METECIQTDWLTIAYLEVKIGEDRADDRVLELSNNCNVIIASRFAYNWIIGKGVGEEYYEGDLSYLKGTYERFGRRESLIIPGTFVEGRKDREDVLAFYNNKRISGFLDENDKRVPKVFEALGMRWGIEFGRELGVYRDANISVDCLVRFPDCYVPEDSPAKKFTIIAREWYEEGERIKHLFEIRKKERWY